MREHDPYSTPMQSIHMDVRDQARNVPRLRDKAEADLAADSTNQTAHFGRPS